MENNGWLKILVEKIQTDLTELKADVKVLLDERAEKRGKTYVVVGLITIGINLVAMWLQAK